MYLSGMDKSLQMKVNYIPFSYASEKINEDNKLERKTESGKYRGLFTLEISEKCHTEGCKEVLGSLPASLLGWALYRRKLGNRATEPSQLKVKYRETVAQESCSPKDQMSLRHKRKEYASFFLELL